MPANRPDARRTPDPSPAANKAPHTDAFAGRRERKKSETRQALRSAAVRLVSERGLDDVTVEDITNAADVSLRTFFNYYSSKEHALTAADPERLARIRVALTARPATEAPLDALRAVLIADAKQFSARHDEWLQQLTVIKTDPRLLAALATSWFDLEQELAAGLADRLDAGDQHVDAEVLAATAVATLRVAIRRWRHDTPQSLPTILSRAFDSLTVTRR